MLLSRQAHASPLLKGYCVCRSLKRVEGTVPFELFWGVCSRWYVLLFCSREEAEVSELRKAFGAEEVPVSDLIWMLLDSGEWLGAFLFEFVQYHVYIIRIT